LASFRSGAFFGNDLHNIRGNNGTEGLVFFSVSNREQTHGRPSTITSKPLARSRVNFCSVAVAITTAA
jgi:hypothetical protein